MSNKPLVVLNLIHLEGLHMTTWVQLVYCRHTTTMHTAAVRQCLMEMRNVWAGPHLAIPSQRVGTYVPNNLYKLWVETYELTSSQF